MIIDEEEELKAAPWYQPGLSRYAKDDDDDGLGLLTDLLLSFPCREISMEILSPLPVGSFLVRCSESRVDSLALSVKVPNSTIVHYLITSGSHGWKIKVHHRRIISMNA